VSRARGRGAALAVPALAAAASLLACGGAGGRSAGAAPTIRPRDAPAPIQLATYTCAQWRSAEPETRAVVVQELHRFYGLPVSGRRRTRAYGTVLRDGQAWQLFDGYCAQRFAASFTLYKIYARAAAFAGVAP
jgi:hypothetical protein